MDSWGMTSGFNGGPPEGDDHSERPPVHSPQVAFLLPATTTFPPTAGATVFPAMMHESHLQGLQATTTMPPTTGATAYPGMMEESHLQGLQATTTMPPTTGATAYPAMMHESHLQFQQATTTMSPTAGATAAYPAIMQESHLQLLQERQKLRTDNQALKQRISQYQELFRNKAKLLEVLRRLGVDGQ